MRTIIPALVMAVAMAGMFHGTAWADEPRVIADCEKIQAADAYNQCLAKFGPESKVKNLEPERPGDIKANGAEAAATAKPVKFKGRGRRGGAGGRKRASFTVSRRRHK